MLKETIETLIGLNYSQREIATNLNLSQSTIKYWLKKYDLKTNNKKCNLKDNVEKYCPKCEEIKSINEFYRRAKRNGGSGYCKKCSNEYTVSRVRDIKLKMIEYKGGECQKCELSAEEAHPAVFDFHHLDPTKKDLNFDRIKYQAWEKIKKELDKCMLVCSNCHRTIHAELQGW